MPVTEKWGTFALPQNLGWPVTASTSRGQNKCLFEGFRLGRLAPWPLLHESSHPEERTCEEGEGPSRAQASSLLVKVPDM